jgi:hypothetical protein
MEKKNAGLKTFNSLCNVKPGKDAWCIQARVLRLWSVPAFLNPKDNNSVEMVLIDEKVVIFF